MAANDIQYLTAPVTMIGGHHDTSFHITVLNPTDQVIFRDLSITGGIVIDASSQVAPSQTPQYPQHIEGTIADGGRRPVLLSNIVVGEWNKPPRTIDLISCNGATLERVSRLGPDIPDGVGILIRGPGIPTMIRIVDCNIHNASQGIVVACWTEGLTVDTTSLVDCLVGINISNWEGVTTAVPAGCFMLNVVGTHMNTRVAAAYLSNIHVGWLDRIFLIKQGTSNGLTITPDCTEVVLGSIVEW